MAKNKKATDDLPTAARTQMTEVPVEVLEERFDHGDIAQSAETDGTDEFPLDEPVEMVDAPAQLREPLTHSQKRRNQRR